MTRRLVIAEDSFLLREGVRMIIETQRDWRVVDVVGSLPDLLTAVKEHDPDVVLTDVRMPPEHTDEGIRAAEAIAKTHPEVGVVVLSQYVEPEWAARLFEPRAAGRAYLLKERVAEVGPRGFAPRAVTGSPSATPGDCPTRGASLALLQTTLRVDWSLGAWGRPGTAIK